MVLGIYGPRWAGSVLLPPHSYGRAHAGHKSAVCPSTADSVCRECQALLSPLSGQSISEAFFLNEI